ncbi:hypothetical protein EAF00_009116 [Botryotinia globosa]|nr:hypothetical protein EAF00_009116 [Botryotinia globosa]
MDFFLGKVTQHAVNYAIRSGIGVTASFAIRQIPRILKTVDNNADYRELHELQERLNSKIKIVSPAIDMIELIAARGNTTLESAVSLTKSLRWDIQSLGMRLAKAASAAEVSLRNKTKAKTQAAHEIEIREILRDIKKLLMKIEDAVPLINLAITTSGANLSTTLPATVSPSRLLQASNLLTAADHQYSRNPNRPVQVGTTLTLSLYMLFAGHAYRAHDEEGMRETTWKEVIHKAKVRLLRVPLRSTYGPSGQLQHSKEARDYLTAKDSSLISGEGKATEYAYQLEIIEDFDDDRVHTFEEGEPQPGPYGDVKLAGIREYLPIHQISKIFYADTGKILNIGNQDETNSPVLLLKRDINAMPPRRMMEGQETQNEWYDDGEDITPEEFSEPNEERLKREDEEDDEFDIDEQLRRESMAPESPSKETIEMPQETSTTWRLPHDLDPEWLALEVYTEAEDSESEEEFESESNEDSSHSRPNTSAEQTSTNDLTTNLSNLKISSPVPATPSKETHLLPRPPSPMPLSFNRSESPTQPLQIDINLRSSLSLLEMLIRLTALQQFQQSTHLSVPDEFLTFFLHESSTTGAGGNDSERKRTRAMARKKVGFDPYDESPVKRHGEAYQPGYEEDGNGRYSRGGTPWDENLPLTPKLTRERSSTPQRSMASPIRSGYESDIRQSREMFSSPPPSSPISPYRSNSQPQFRQRREQGNSYRGNGVGGKSNGGPLERVYKERGGGTLSARASPLGKGGSLEMSPTPESSKLVASIEGRGEDGE